MFFLMKSLLFMPKLQHKTINCFSRIITKCTYCVNTSSKVRTKKGCLEDLSLTRVIYDGKVEYAV